MTSSVSGQDGAVLPAWDFSLGPARSTLCYMLYYDLVHGGNEFLTEWAIERNLNTIDQLILILSF